MGMVAYKLMRLRRDGTLGPLFINRRQVLPLGVWMDAESHPTRGFALRPWWHLTWKPEAPHLSMKGRVWVKAEVEEYETCPRPRAQGGTWVLAKRMRLLEVLAPAGGRA